MNYEKAEKLEDKLRRKKEGHRFRQAVNSLAQQLLTKIQPFFVLVFISLFVFSFLAGLFGFEDVGKLVFLFLFLSAIASLFILSVTNIRKD